MVTYPYTIANGSGERLTFTGVTQGPSGERLGADGVAQPGAGPPMHVHYLQEEAVRVVRGRVGYQLVGGPPQYAGPGERFRHIGLRSERCGQVRRIKALQREHSV